MSIERERYDQMMQRRTGWDRIKAWFVFPPLSREEPPTTPPSGGTSARPAPWHPSARPGEIVYLQAGDPAPPGRRPLTEDEIKRVALDLDHAIRGPARTAMTYVGAGAHEHAGILELQIDGSVDLIELAKAAINAVRSNGL